MLYIMANNMFMRSIYKFNHEPSVLTKKMKWEIFEGILITIGSETVIVNFHVYKDAE